jgi:hypothetical protein
LEKIIGYLNSSKKNTQFQKINQQKQSLESEVINISNLVIFTVFLKKATRFIEKGNNGKEIRLCTGVRKDEDN